MADVVKQLRCFAGGAIEAEELRLAAADEIERLRGGITDGLVASSSVDHQQRLGAPLTFWLDDAVRHFSAAATRDDVTVRDAMRAALHAVEQAMLRE